MRLKRRVLVDAFVYTAALVVTVRLQLRLQRLTVLTVLVGMFSVGLYLGVQPRAFKFRVSVNATQTFQIVRVVLSERQRRVLPRSRWVKATAWENCGAAPAVQFA